MKNKIAWIVGIVIVVALVIFLNISKTDTKSIKIGAVLPLTGPSSAIGEILKQGLELKVAELKDGGMDITLYSEDSASDPKQAVSAFNKLTAVEGIHTIFTITSGDSMPLLPLVESRKDTILWADATVPALTDGTSFVLRHASTVQDGVKLITESVLKTGPKKIGIMYQQDDFGVFFNKLLTSALQEKGIQTISEQINNKGADFRSNISKIKAENPDGIVYGILGPAIGVSIKQTRELGFKGQLYSGVGFGLTPDAQKIAGDAAKGLLYQKYVLNPKFIEAYKARFGVPGNALGYVPYTDVELLTYAIKQTGSTEAKVLINFIKNLGSFQGEYEKVKIDTNGDIVIPTTMEVW